MRRIYLSIQASLRRNCHEKDILIDTGQSQEKLT